MKFINRIRKRVLLERKLLVLRILFIRKNFNPENSILIFSAPRGGSTWLAELVALIPKSFIYWEPLAINHNKKLRKLNFGWRQHIPENFYWPKAKKVFDKILSISILNEWTVLKINTTSCKSLHHPIVKICRGNHLLSWLVNQYNFKYRPLYLVRHPVAVIASQLKQGGWKKEYNGFKLPDMPFNETYVQHQIFLESLKTKAEALLAIWCITNKELLSNIHSKWHLIYYENLLLNPTEVLNEFFEIWNIPIPKEIANTVNKWSSTAIDHKGVASIEQLSKWQTEFTKNELNRLQKVLDYFEISSYSIENPLPSILITK